jgi:preprotein translocase SecE subunit
MKLMNFLNEAIIELKTVQWPSKEEAIKLTSYVVIVSVVVGILIFGFDYLLNIGLSYII